MKVGKNVVLMEWKGYFVKEKNMVQKVLFFTLIDYVISFLIDNERFWLENSGFLPS